MARIDQYWRDRFGLTDQLNRPGVHLVVHPRYSGEDLILTLVKSDVAIVAAAGSQLEVIRSQISSLTPQDLLLQDHYPRLSCHPISHYVGPLYEGFLDDQEFRPADIKTVVRLDRDSVASLRTFEQACAVEGESRTAVWREVFDRFVNACDSQEVEQSGITATDSALFAVVDGVNIMALAHYSMWAHNAASIGVLVRPELRGCGHGKSVVSAAIGDALSRGYLVLYRTLVANRASVALATSLGCQDYARYLAVHLKTAA